MSPDVHAINLLMDIFNLKIFLPCCTCCMLQNNYKYLYVFIFEKVAYL